MDRPAVATQVPDAEGRIAGSEIALRRPEAAVRRVNRLPASKQPGLVHLLTELALLRTALNARKPAVDGAETTLRLVLPAFGHVRTTLGAARSALRFTAARLGMLRAALGNVRAFFAFTNAKLRLVQTTLDGVKLALGDLQNGQRHARTHTREARVGTFARGGHISAARATSGCAGMGGLRRAGRSRERARGMCPRARGPSNRVRRASSRARYISRCARDTLRRVKRVLRGKACLASLVFTIPAEASEWGFRTPVFT